MGSIRVSLNDAGNINLEKARELAAAVKPLVSRQDTYMDQRFYPGADIDVDLQIMYFMAMVSIDHRLTVPGFQYETEINGVQYRGADLLWLRGRLLLEKDPSAFFPSRLASASPQWVREWLGDAWDYGVRAFLLRDVGSKIQFLYDGSPSSLLKKSGGHLINGGRGFVELLKSFTAFTDPVEKKAMLLAKFLHGRGLIKFVDVHNEEVAVDNHLSRLAIRLGLIEPSREYMKMIEHAVPFTPQQDVFLRMLIRYGWKLVSMLSDVEPFALDDFLWSFGRTTCIADNPKCNDCPLRNSCSLKELHPREHVFNATYWY
ncbi:iron-sulfur cluster protein [Thermocladium modestius]|uniref:Iron-sulfur cluster protein n=1 Tax=Thermocladium modestius TaxID=62609 RepID=A0A830GTW7_9CREN|nr:hypothetical protein [Thermocladium modestius]GGP21215.1 iron-sulfur cluster protein [Thermocladium modestius]